MKILNLDDRDYHMHSLTFSDGLSHIDDIVKFAGDIGLTEIAITDHSNAAIKYSKKKHGFFSSGARYSLKRWQNVFNDVNVIFGIEGDLLNEKGDVCFEIQGIEPDFIILSAHDKIYKGKPENITEATIKAIEKHHKKIKFIGHPCNNADFGEHYEIEKLIQAANKYNIPVEFNAKNLYRGKSNLKKLDYLLKNANEVYLNSDAHTLRELKEVRKYAIGFLRDNKYI